MAEEYDSAGTDGEGFKKKKRDGGSDHGGVELDARRRPSKRLKTLDVSVHKPSRNKRRWNEMLQTGMDMSVDDDDDENTETEAAVREHRSSRRRTARSRGGDSDDGLVRNGLGTVSLQERGESSEHIPDCEEEQEDQTAIEEKQQEGKGEEIWMRYCPQVNTSLKSQKVKRRESTVASTKKRKASNIEELHEHQQQPEEKKTRIGREIAEEGDRVLDSEDASMRVEAGKRKWKRVPQSESSDMKSTDEMGVKISEAWKRLREEEEADDENDGIDNDSVHVHSYNGSSLSSETTEKEMTRGGGGSLRKKVRLEKSYQGKKWRRQEKLQAADSKRSSKRPHEKKDNESTSSGSSGSSGASCTHLHNRMWKRPRFENLTSVQGRMARNQQQQQQQQQHNVEESSKKRSASETSGMLKKRQRK